MVLTLAMHYLQGIMKLTLSCVWFWNHSVYLLIRLWHGTRAGAPLSAAWGPDKSCLGWSCQQGEEVWGSTQGLALRNDAISACATLSPPPPPPHKLDPAEQVTVGSAGDRWVVTHIHTRAHMCHHTCKYGYCRDGEAERGFWWSRIIAINKLLYESNLLECRSDHSWLL